VINPDRTNLYVINYGQSNRTKYYVFNTGMSVFYERKNDDQIMRLDKLCINESNKKRMTRKKEKI
jgi:hypothetical protein